jgi:hypothetical protein
MQFYVNRYLLGHPDEPKRPQDLAMATWVWHPALQDIMTAIGLAGLSNLSSSSDLMNVARSKYGRALRRTGSLIQRHRTPDMEITMRSVVLLALYEVCFFLSTRHPAVCDCFYLHTPAG